MRRGEILLDLRILDRWDSELERMNEGKEGAWYRKLDLVELGLHMAVMNSFAEGAANILRCQGKVPTGETLLDYVKTMTCDEMLADAKAQVDCCVK